MSISTESFERLSALLLKQSGIVVTAGKEYLVESRLNPLAKQHGYESLETLIDHLARSKPLVEEVIDAMTTNETSFLRDKHPFDALCDEILPGLIEQRANVRTLRIWSAACSTGQEIYTIAMLLRERFPELRNWKIELLATDISPSVIERASEGSYSQVEVNRGLPAPMMLKYFKRSGTRWTIAPELRGAVEFRQLNLLQPVTGVQPMDVVFLRNVLIYFKPETKAQVLVSVHKLMAPDGFLMLGAAETTMGLTDKFSRTQFANAAGYRRSPEEAPCT